MNYNTVIPSLVQRFPELEKDEVVNLEDHPMQIIGLFVFRILLKALVHKESKKIESAVLFVNELCSNDSEIEITQLIDEIAIGLVSESQSQYDYFVSLLDAHAQERMNESANLWKRGNGLT